MYYRPSIKDVRTNGGGVKQKWANGGGGGRQLNRTSISEDFEQIFCVSDSEDTSPPLRGPPELEMLRFRRFRAIRSGRLWTGGRGSLPNG